MTEIRRNLTVMEFEEAQDNRVQGGYKYLVRGAYITGYKAFKTDAGMRNFLKTRNVELKKREEREFEDIGKVITYDVIGEIEDRTFWHLAELPENAERFTDLVNGSLVDCYTVHTEAGAIIYMPNPNAKDVYHPMPIEEHMRYIVKNG